MALTINRFNWVYFLAGFLNVLSVMCTSEKLHPLSDDFIEKTNKQARTWTAKRQFNISEWDKVKKIASGSFRSWEFDFAQSKHPGHNESQPLPEFFDSATRWPKCQSIRQIRDQSNCGSCWAFGAAEAMSDRICIHSNQEMAQVFVSAQDLLTCCPMCGGCEGGDPLTAWKYWTTTGISTGGLYNRLDQGCKPYTFPPCEDCEEASTPKCLEKCADDENYQHSLTFGKSFYVLNGERQIMLEILKNGPVQGNFLVPEDFFNYHRGVYHPTTSDIVGAHSVKIVGWGTDEYTEMKYWKVANSWGESWGEHGYFRIKRGLTSIGLESDAVAGIPMLKKEFWKYAVVSLR